MQAMRDAILTAAAHAPTETPRLASSGMVIGGILAAAIAAGVVAAGTYQSAAPQSTQDSGAPLPAADAPSLRQLQFSTPGGTRIIWQFDPDFSLRETIP
jgi:hypothetical protein